MPVGKKSWKGFGKQLYTSEREALQLAGQPAEDGEASSSAIGAIPDRLHEIFEADSINQRIDNQGVIHIRINRDCNNVTTKDNRIDNRVNQSTRTSTKIIHNYPLPGEPVRKVHFMVPFSKNTAYVGVSQTLEQVNEKIKQHDCSHHRVALCGMGGIGMI